ncbi:MAG: hypothetical protein SGBAC_010503 [Bacillariaceae sp.]
MSSFGDSLSKGINAKFRKSLSFKGKGKPKDVSSLLNDTEECSLSSTGGNLISLNRRSLPKSEKETASKVGMPTKKFRKSFSACNEENSSGETYDRSSRQGKEVLDVRRQSLLERQDHLIGDVLPEIKEKRRSKNKSRTDAATSYVDDDNTQVSSRKSKKKKKKSRKQSLEIFHDEYGDCDLRPDAVGKVSKARDAQKKKTRKSNMALTDDRLQDVKAGKLNQVEASGERKSKKKKIRRPSKIANDTATEGVDLSPKGSKKSKKLKKKKVKRKSQFTASLLDDLELELGSIDRLAAEDTTSNTVENIEKQSTDVNDSAPEMNYEVDRGIGTAHERYVSNELNATLLDEDTKQPKVQLPLNREEEKSTEKAEKIIQASEMLNREESLNDEKNNSSKEQLSFTPTTSLMSETNEYAMSLMYGTSDDSDEDGNSTYIGNATSHHSAESEVEAESQASNSTCELSTHLDASSIVYEVASDSHSDFSDVEVDAEQEESQSQLVPTVEEHVRDGDSEEVDEPKEIIQVEQVPIAEELPPINSDEGEEATSAALRKQTEQLQGLLRQLQLETQMLEESMAIHKSKAIEKNNTITMYKGMVEDLQEDYDMVLRTYHEQVEQNELLLGQLGKMKHVGLKNERVLREKTDRIEGLEQQLTLLQQSQDCQVLFDLKDENERLQKMVNLQKKSLFQMIADTKVIQC